MRRILAVGIVVLSALAERAMAQAPSVFPNGVVNTASFAAAGQPGFASAPGTIVAIFGTSLASSFAQASSVPLSTSLGGVSVTFNGVPAPLYVVSAGQINAQLPFEVSGSTASIVVTTSAGPSAPQTVQMAAASPAIFTANAQGTGQGIVVFALEPTVFAAAPGGLFPACPPPSPSAPCARQAKEGDFLTIYANGLGAVQPAVTSGNAAPGAEPLARTVTNPVVTIGGVQSTQVLFSGLVPNLVGLYQINFQVPTGVPKGATVPIQISMNGVTSSNLVTIAVQ